MNIQKIWNNISNLGIEHETDKELISYIRLLNQYIIIVFFVFFIHSIHNFLYIKDMYSGNVLMYLSLFFLIALLVPGRIKKIKLLSFCIFILLVLTIFFYESYSKNGSGIYFYYFPLILALPFVFNLKTDYLYPVIIIVITLLSVLLNIATDYSWFANNNLTTSIKRNTTLISASISGMIVIIDLVFIVKKNYALHKLYEEANEKEILLEEQQKQLQQLSKKETAGRAQELVSLVINNDSSFFSAFSEAYPTFFPDLLKMESDLSVAELEFCACIKLGFSIKEISTYKFISVRAVEGRKYRIRKKLNFSSGKELITWILDYDSTTDNKTVK